MLSKKMETAICKQIQEELFSSYLYLSMSAYFSNMGLDGFANWMSVQEKEERDHAMKFYNYLLSQGAEIKLFQINEPDHKWKSPLDAFKATLKHEQHITKCINGLVDLAEKEKDRATFNFLQWYIDEQVEEEENDRNIIDKLTLIKENSNGLFMLDKDLAQRVYTPLIPAV
ncbi:MAG: ferritin [Candidatus Delongbacteria bacterium]|nr:ferritin [Candidatus Delongbacteria bacterium]MDD4205738.1 ferritin [Candidatus Delongbacteria bacterium]MDY0017886.1 ferritin [Candidatus Delongbacteria bacterium]